MMQLCAPPPPPPPVHHWVRLLTPEGRPYFFYPALNQTSWTPPLQIPPMPMGMGMGMSHGAEQAQQGPVVERAVSMRRVEGTEWRIVFTNLNCHFFHHAAMKASTWKTPLEVKDIVRNNNALHPMQSHRPLRSHLCFFGVVHP